MALRKCPVCRASVKLENLERHVRGVHPAQKVPLELSEKDRRTIRAGKTVAGEGFHVKRSTIAAAIALALAVVGVAVAWPYLSRPSPGGPVHIHPHLQITIDGQNVPVPANVGIDPELWKDHSLDQYSSEGMPMAPLHTHDATGRIHVESKVTRDYTLQEFWTVWGKGADQQQVLGHAAGLGHSVWLNVDGRRMAPTDVVLFREGMHIEVVCGPA